MNNTDKIEITRETIAAMGTRYVVRVNGDRIGFAPTRRDANRLAEHYTIATTNQEEE